MAAHLEAYLACCKAALVPFNVNFRYGVDELVYLLDNADTRAVVGADEFVPALEAWPTATNRTPRPGARRPRVVRVRVGDGCEATDSPAPRGWVEYESIVAGAALGPRSPLRGAAVPTTSCSSSRAAPPGCRRP